MSKSKEERIKKWKQVFKGLNQSVNSPLSHQIKGQQQQLQVNEPEGSRRAELSQEQRDGDFYLDFKPPNSDE